jgi:hypothetical protein
MPARRTSRPSSRWKLRASITALTWPSPCASNAHGAADAGSAAMLAVAANAIVSRRILFDNAEMCTLLWLTPVVRST